MTAMTALVIGKGGRGVGDAGGDAGGDADKRSGICREMPYL